MGKRKLNALPYHRCILPETGQVKFSFRKQILQLIQVSDMYPGTSVCFRSNAAIIMERKRHAESAYYYIIHPLSIFRIFWEAFMITVYLISLITTPVYIFSNLVQQNCSFDILFFLMITVDGLCILDIVVTCFSGFIDVNVVKMNQAEIFKQYIRSGSFPMDVLTSLPLHLRCEALLPGSSTWRILVLITLMKGLRARKMLNYSKKFSDIVYVNISVYNLAIFMVMLLLIIHWTASMLLIISMYKIQDNIAWKKYSWVLFELVNDTAQWIPAYTHALYRITGIYLGVLNSSFMLNDPFEVLFISALYICGYIGSAVFLVLILQLVLSTNMSATKYESIMSQLNQYMSHRQLPLQLQQRLSMYYGHRFKSIYFRENFILSLLSDRLQKEISLYCYAVLVENVRLFHSLNEKVVREIVSSLKCEIFLPNDVIIKAGGEGTCMYFISYGTVAVSTPTGREVCHLYDGSYFGEIALLMKDKKRNANVVAIEICEVYKLEQKIFKRYLATDPDTYKGMEKVAKDRTNRTNFLEELHKKHLLERSLAMKHDAY